MSFTAHHQPVASGLSWNLHAWQLAWNGNSKWDPAGAPNGVLIDIPFPDLPDPRVVSFKYRSVLPNSNADPTWEADDFVRQLAQIPQGDIWTFESTRRVLYQDPSASKVKFGAGAMLTFQVLTKSRFSGGQLYCWNPYDRSNPTAFFPESARNNGAGLSTFVVALAGWMTGGFHLKLVGSDNGWEPDAGNRVWRPVDGDQLWLKSGQCDVRSTPLALTPSTLEVLVPASLPSAPSMALHDVAENDTFLVPASGLTNFPASPLFKIATYQPAIYPGAAYTLSAESGESATITRPFPADPSVPAAVSRFVLGAGAWLSVFPTVSSVTLSIQPQAASSFGAGLSVQTAVGNAAPYQTVAASQGKGGIWTVVLTVAPDTTTSVRLSPVDGAEPTPYAWIDTARYFNPGSKPTTVYTAEGLFGITSRGPVTFDDSPARKVLMQAAFGAAIAGARVFDAAEMPQGATVVGADVYFVVHAPHAAWAGLVYVTTGAGGKLARLQVAMSLTADRRYWWCKLPATTAIPSMQYHFILNDELEILDPAAREVLDRGSFDVGFEEDPNDVTTAWSLVADVDAFRTAARAQPWQTMGWQSLLIYELHAARFTGLSPGTLGPLELLTDELGAISRLRQPGYLNALPATSFELLPIQEFNSALSWGYDPSFYFAVDGHYGGGAALAGFVNAAHANGRAVLLDVVYNHSLGSPLMKIAPDVYRHGDYDGDRMNCGHPMVLEHFRQATLLLWRTFGLDGFRFDDTNTITTQCPGGWEFLQAIRAAVRAAATAEGRAWPYCMAENRATQPWDISDPGFGVMDGQWGIDEAYGIRAASYDSWKPGPDDAGPLAQNMNAPAYWGRPFSQVVRFGESHDMVSFQDAGNKRIAARPPLGQGRQLAKAMGALALLSNGIPMLFMGQEYGETIPFFFDSTKPPLDPQAATSPTAPIDQQRVLAWFLQLMGLRNDSSQGLQGDANYQVVQTGNRTVAFTCGAGQRLFAVVTFGTANQQQDSGWLGLPGGSVYKEIFNSSWPVFAVEFEPEQTNGGYDARIVSGQILNLPYTGAVVLQRL